MLRQGHPSSSKPSNRDDNIGDQPAVSLRRSSRKRRPTNLGYDTESDPEDSFQLRRAIRQSKPGKNEAKSSQDEQNDDNSIPRREGLRPRRGTRNFRQESSQESEDEDQGFSEEDDREDEGAEDCEVGDEEGEREEREEEEDEEGEERDGRRRYALRTRTEVQRFSPQTEERPISKSFTFRAGVKRNRDGKRMGSRSDKRHRTSRGDDSDDSLLIDEIVHMQGPPWLKGGSLPGQTWPFGGLDMSGFQNWSMGAAATGWGHQGDQWAASSGVQTTGLSHKGGADIQPLQVDDSITFDQVGGLSHYVQSLKEMVFFPLLYPKFFQNYGIKPPRGVLLCGPPGTGKTLIARALAASATRAGQRINFYMRKGADVLSKWVGEAERQLRMLFEEAQRTQPSIIFFDEIDGLAPVRSSKQEQIHNSIVSTLLALMDGLDSLGQVIVIGATNRVDAIDGALRRPGRFDRELTFSLPDSKARAEILKIHTRQWKEPPTEELCKELAASCVGYCGADLKALCTEAAIGAFRKKYPQIYTSDDPLLIDANSVQVKRRDFLEAMSTITPAAQRGTLVQSMPLSPIVAPCLENQLKIIMETIADIFPLEKSEGLSKIPRDSDSTDELTALSTLHYGSSFPFVYRPRLLLCGKEEAGIEHLGPAVLHELEKFPVHSLSLPSLLSDMGSRTPEEALVNIFREARRTTPAVLYLPQIELWWETAHAQLRTVLLMLLAELPSNLPLLLLATAKVYHNELEERTSSIFGSHIYEIGRLTSDDRANFFSHMLETALNISEHKHHERNEPETLPELPKAPIKEREVSEAELQAQSEEEQHALRRMRMCLRGVCNRLLYEKCFSVFHYPVTEEDAPNYHAVIQHPMDVSTLLQRTDSGQYLTRAAFLQDLELIPLNAKVYHGDDYNGARIVSKACALRDAAHGMLSQIDKELVALCDEILARGGPLKLNGDDTVGIANPQVSQPAYVTRASARLHGFQPNVDVSQDPEVHARRSKRNSDADVEVETMPGSIGHTPVEASLKLVDPDANVVAKELGSLVSPTQLLVSQGNELEGRGELSVQLITETGKDHQKACKASVASNDRGSTHDGPISCSRNPGGKDSLEVVYEVDCRTAADRQKTDHRIHKIKKKFVKQTRGFGVSDLELIHAHICQSYRSQTKHIDISCLLKLLEDFVANMKQVETGAKCDGQAEK